MHNHVIFYISSYIVFSVYGIYLVFCPSLVRFDLKFGFGSGVIQL